MLPWVGQRSIHKSGALGLPGETSLKPGVSQIIAMHASPIVRDVFLSKSGRPGPFTFIRSKFSPLIFLRYLWLIRVPIVAHIDVTSKAEIGLAGEEEKTSKIS